MSPEELDARLRALAARPLETGIFCDFDGSLSAIVGDPERARPVRGAQTALAKLARIYGVVAVVSGRNLASLTQRLRVPGIRMLGSYGLEERSGRRSRVLDAAEVRRLDVERAALRLEREMQPFTGVLIERKGLSVAVHFRQAPDPDAAEALAAPAVRAVAEELVLDVLPGRRVLELRPPVRVDKGVAVRRLVAEHGLRAALFAGDDHGDVPAFRALDSLEVALRIAVASEEAPPEVLAAADTFVDGPRALVRLLRRLAAAP